jgi:hypothetical protein
MGLFDVGGKFKPRNVAGVKSTRFIEPHDCEEIDEWRVKYANAEKLAADVGDLPVNFRAFCILDGKFIFGDFIEALVVKNNWACDDLTISTLSMSQDNVDSLANLVNGNYVKSLNIIVSHYYFANERHADGLMPYLYEKLDVRDVLQLAVASVHTKIAMIRTACGKKITIHGSANLRTSSNIEQIVIEHSPGLYDWCHEVHAGIIERHKTINKPVRRTQLWSSVLGNDESDTPPWPADQTATEKNSVSKATAPLGRQRRDDPLSAARKAGV